MMATTASLGVAGPLPSNVSLSGLDGVNFVNAGMLAGFGPYVAAYLAAQGWTPQNIGFVLTASGLAGLLSQVPGGELLDISRSKRAFVAAGAAILARSAVILSFQPTFPLAFTALMLPGITGGFLRPASAAISLGLVGHDSAHKPRKPLEESRADDVCHLPVPVPTRECLPPAAGRGGPRLPGRKELLAHRLGIDRAATDHRCRDGSLGRTAGKKLGPPASSSHRVHRFADPRAVVRSPDRFAVACRFSVARWHQWSRGGSAHAIGDCRHDERHWSLQHGPGHRWNSVRNRCFTQHYTLRSRSGKFWPLRCISEYCIGGSACGLDPLVSDARDKAID